ncbi:FAD:protein FMN transferase [Robiginitalea aurantiaca]|uniref:FAD:protein FMN transferase n=1 Tax=Robiginitalea aurantiaca TaxID=3056915 RepID=A0ABT7WIK7_9FLAO|nr:FAD:protein FMN transferase [Robiginitalea aurantiaca]MDM9632745.1 FAD:protein FMN transferase [Robiginitalea aurantiaca]
MKALLKSRGWIFLLWALVAVGCADKGPLREQVYQGGALGTSYAIKVFTADTTDLQPQIDSVFKVVNQSLSTYLPGSDISRINDGDTSVVVDAMFAEVFKASLEIHRQTDGYFDPTVGVLVDAWGFGPGAAQEMDSTRVDSLLHYVGLKKVQLTPDSRIVMETPGIRLDFNAIAKGYAVDRLGLMLEGRGVSDYLVEVGGELRTLGMNQLKKQPWVVGIDDPQVLDGRRIKQIITLSDRAMASSGNYRKFRVDSTTGKKFVHTIDPRTGFTRDSRILAVSVLAQTCMVADGYATAFMAMDLERSMDIFEANPNLEGYIVYLNDEGTAEEYMTPGFESLLQQDL